MTRGACLLMKTFGFGNGLHGAGAGVAHGAGVGAGVAHGAGVAAHGSDIVGVNTIGSGNPQPQFCGSAVANDCNSIIQKFEISFIVN